MQATARYPLTDAYFREDYEQWIRYVARWRPWQPYVGCCFLVIGGLSAVLGFPIAAALGLVVGIVEFAEMMIHKSRWLAARLRGCRAGREVQLVFTNESIAEQGSFSSGNLEWAGIERVRETPKGLFLIPQDGMHVYIPDYALEPASAKQDIIARITAQNSTRTNEVETKLRGE
jgi:hypothetical protein